MAYYFDNAATTRISVSALQAYERVSNEYWGNPSSLHAEGRKAKKLLDETRGKLATVLGVPVSSLTFTSCATESDGIVLSSLLWAKKCGEVIIPSFEHGAVSGYERLLRQYGWKVVSVSAPNGFLDPEEIAGKLSEDTRMVLCMAVNNVLGTIQPVSDIVKVVRDFEKRTGRPIHIHSDATQALGKIPFSLKEEGVDSAAFSAHKVHGPKGVGLLYDRNPAIISLSRGGGQEQGLRPGTENLPGIVAMEVAFEDALTHLEENRRKVISLNSYIRSRLSAIKDIEILTPLEKSSPFILNFTNKRYPSEVLTRILYDKDCCVSSGSACSNNARSHQNLIMTGMAFSPAQAQGSIRLSFGNDNTLDEARILCDRIESLFQGEEK